MSVKNVGDFNFICPLVVLKLFYEIVHGVDVSGEVMSPGAVGCLIEVGSGRAHSSCHLPISHLFLGATSLL